MSEIAHRPIHAIFLLLRPSEEYIGGQSTEGVLNHVFIRGIRHADEVTRFTEVAFSIQPSTCLD